MAKRKSIKVKDFVVVKNIDHDLPYIVEGIYDTNGRQFYRLRLCGVHPNHKPVLFVDQADCTRLSAKELAQY